MLYIVDAYNPKGVDPSDILNKLKETIQRKLSIPSQYQFKVSLQTHSVTVSLIINGKEFFFVDIVPAYTSGIENEFGQDIYWVPEIVTIGPSKRKEYYEKLSESHTPVKWIKSDPRGYISLAQALDQRNSDFRKVVKFIKRWKFGCKSLYDDFKFKSFHIEQVIAGYFKRKTDLEFFDAVFNFFYEIPNIISRPQIKDRADSNRFIDNYLNDISVFQNQFITSEMPAHCLVSGKRRNTRFLAIMSSIAGFVNSETSLLFRSKRLSSGKLAHTGFRSS